MTCDEATRDLIGYHFGLLEPGARARLEDHLLACPSCVGTFVLTKRAVETGEADPRPSPAARDRLRRAVAAEVAPQAAPRSRWERPIAFVVAACVLVGSTAAAHAITGPPRAPLVASEPRFR